MSSQYASLLPPYIPTRGISRLLCIVFLFTAAVSWIAVGYDFAEIRLAEVVRSGASIEPAERLAHSATGHWIGVFQIFCFAVTGLLFISWLHRARVNIRALGMRRMQYRREWTIVGFLIPVLNALRPYQVVREIWQASDPRSGDPMEWKYIEAPITLPLWWLCFVAYVLLEIVSATVLDFSAGLRGIRASYGLGLAADVFAAISASLAYFVVSQISEAQELKRATWGRGDHYETANHARAGNATV
jgi:hypothetical protein